VIDLLIVHAAELCTLADGAVPRRRADLGQLGLLRDAFLAVDGGRVLGAGPMAQLPAAWRQAREVYDASGQAVLPGFVDPHTHVVYAGDRTGEFKLRLAGASYAEIGRTGGGILATVRETRAATVDGLVAASRPRLARMLAAGTTTAEVKSGYGLTTADELKLLDAVRALGRSQPVELVATFMGAHEVPLEHRGAPARYVDLIVDEMLPAVARQGIARFCDVFCEEGVFDHAATRRILAAGRQWGLVPRLHADELASGFGGAELAAELGARTADHLVRISPAGIDALARADVTAVLLPGTSFFLGLDAHAPARRLIEAGVAVALATDCNPGSCPIESMAVVVGLACLLYRLTPAEALCAATLNAAWALGLHTRLGSLEAGKQADVLALAEPSHEAIPYRFGSNLVAAVWKAGRRVA
jgi:imidazolonepropionase